MKTKNILAIFLLSAILFACEKPKEEEDKKPSFDALKDNAIAENIFGDVFNQSGKASRDAEDETSQKNDETLLSCPTITITPFDTTWPKVVTLNYGNTNCVGSDFRQRRGEVFINATQSWRTAGSITIITFNNFYIDDHKVEGTQKITNMGRNQSNNLVYKVEVLNAKVTKPDGKFLLWSSERFNEWIEGENTILNPFDDVYLISGNITGTSSSNEDYTIDTQTPLNVKFGCRWVRAGIIDINIVGLNTIKVDYGNGDCDPNVKATYNNVTYDLILQ
jgi:hypothetical protein